MIDFTSCSNIALYNYTASSQNYTQANEKDSSIPDEIATKLTHLHSYITEKRHAGWLVIIDTLGALGSGIGTKYFIETLQDRSEGWFTRRTRQFLHLNGALNGIQRIALNPDHTKRLIGLQTATKGMGHRTAMLIGHITQATVFTHSTRALTLAKECKSRGEWGKVSVRKQKTDVLANLLHDWISQKQISPAVYDRLKILRLRIPSSWDQQTEVCLSKKEFVEQIALENKKNRSSTHLPKDGSVLAPEEALFLRELASTVDQNSTAFQAEQMIIPQTPIAQPPAQRTTPSPVSEEPSRFKNMESLPKPAHLPNVLYHYGQCSLQTSIAKPPAQRTISSPVPEEPSRFTNESTLPKPARLRDVHYHYGQCSLSLRKNQQEK